MTPDVSTQAVDWLLRLPDQLGLTVFQFRKVLVMGKIHANALAEPANDTLLNNAFFCIPAAINRNRVPASALSGACYPIQLFFPHCQKRF